VAVSAADIEYVRELAATLPDAERLDLSALESPAAVLAFVATSTRATGGDEADGCEIVARGAGMTPDEVRQVASVLAPVGLCRRERQAAADRRAAKAQPQAADLISSTKYTL
jgi:hypothetical protein